MPRVYETGGHKMRNIRLFLINFLLTFLGYHINQPVRLDKKEEKPSYFVIIRDKIDAWVNRHAVLLFLVIFALLIALFVCLIFAITGMSATESGMTYNHFMDVI